MMNDMTEILQKLTEYQEFQAVCWAAYALCLLLLVILLGVFIAHSAFLITGSRVLYRRKVPQDGWSKQFYPALGITTLLTGFVAWFLWHLALGIIPLTN